MYGRPGWFHSNIVPYYIMPFFIYSWLSLSRTRLSRITAYLEVKIWSLPKHENLTAGKKYCGKEEKLLPRSNFSSISQYLQYIFNFMSPITYKFVKCSYTNYFFLNSANLICRSTDISKYFRESLGIRDNESRLYFWNVPKDTNVEKTSIQRWFDLMLNQRWIDVISTLCACWILCI